YDTPADRPALGQPLEIRLVSGGFQVNWDNVRLTATNPSMTTDPATGAITWTPTGAQVGTYDVALRVSDGRGGTADQTYTILVEQEAGNHAPAIVSRPVTRLAAAEFIPGSDNDTVFTVPGSPGQPVSATF